MKRAAINMVGDNVRSLHLAGEKFETPHVVTYQNNGFSTAICHA